MRIRFAIHAVVYGLLTFAVLANASGDRPLQRLDLIEHTGDIEAQVPPAANTADAESALSALFTAVLERSTADDPRREHWQNGLLGTWSVQLDRSLLDRPQRDQGLALQQRISADLPLLARARVLRLDAVYEESNGSFSRTVIVEGDEASLVTLTTGPEGMIGRIHTEGRLYLIEARESAFINVPTSTWLRAKACTSGSCSGYSPQGVATVWPGICL